MALSEEAFSQRVEAGCSACGGKKVVVEAYVARKFVLLEGEVYGRPSWGYKGEDLVRGTYAIRCAACAHAIYEDDACPRCASDGGLARALETESALAFPRACVDCGGTRLTATALVPASVIYEGRRAQKARTETEPEDAGFHSYRVECKGCPNVIDRKKPCPVCAAS